MFLIHHLRCENAENPLGIDTSVPRFGWQLTHSRRDQQQTACQIWVATQPALLEQNAPDVWDSGKMVVNQNFGVEFAGHPLKGLHRYYWKVRAWDNNDIPGEFSSPAWFETAFLSPYTWQADWLGYPAGSGGQALYFRLPFDLEEKAITGRAYLCALGLHELHINGQKIGDRVLEPAQTEYSKRAFYSTYDISSQIQPGKNVIGVVVGQGWFGKPIFSIQICITRENGEKIWIRSDRGGNNPAYWQVTYGPITNNSIFDGETYDARKELTGWDTPQYMVNSNWTNATIVDRPAGQIVSQNIEPIRVINSLPPVTSTVLSPGKLVFDFGQNLAGWAKISVSGPAGSSISLRFAESIYPDGSVNQENLRLAKVTDTYILRGGALETWEPCFTYHGFRYVQAEFDSDTLEIKEIAARIVHSDVQENGHFNCSHPLLNRIHQMVWWTESSNLHGIPTDCPQRNERMGWLNDMAARTEEALFNFNLNRLLSKWITDIADGQADDGTITDTAPFRWGRRPADPVSVCFLMIPLRLYQHYGNKRILQENYDALQHWVDALIQRSSGGILEYSYYGDWSPPIAEGISGSIGSSAVSKGTPGPLVSTAFAYYTTSILVQIAGILGKKADVHLYSSQKDAFYEAYNQVFYDPSTGGYGSNNQACNALSMYMGLVPPDRQTTVMTNLAKDVIAHDYHLTTGNLCTKYLLEVLSENGYAELAFRLATQTTYPGWGYMLANGATTLWERWELATGGGMNSHNHPMMGSVGSWFYKYAAGIQPDLQSEGFTRIIISPRVTPWLESAEATLNTIHGQASVAWSNKAGQFTLNVKIPANCPAAVHVPYNGRTGAVLSENMLAIWPEPTQSVPGIRQVSSDGNEVLVEIGSGDYRFMLDQVSAPS